MGSDWEFLCDHYGQVNDGNSDWLERMLDVEDNATKTKLNNNAFENPFKKYGSEKTFSDLKEAKAYALNNPRSVFIRNPKGKGFVIKRTELDLENG